MGLLVDTSIMVRIEREETPLAAFIDSLRGEDAAISAITASDLLVGVLRAAPDPRRIRREAFVEYVIERFPVLPVDLAVARAHARLWTELRAAGTMIGLHDLIIAATAVAYDHAVLTDNVREFAHVQGLKVRPGGPQ